MLKYLLAGAVAFALIAAPVTPSFAQATTTEKTEKKTEKKAAKKPSAKQSAQQQKMKDCAAKWGDHKKEKKVSGRTEHRKFMSECLKA